MTDAVSPARLAPNLLRFMRSPTGSLDIDLVAEASKRNPPPTYGPPVPQPPDRWAHREGMCSALSGKGQRWQSPCGNYAVYGSLCATHDPAAVRRRAARVRRQSDQRRRMDDRSGTRPPTPVERLALAAWFELRGGADAFAELGRT